jgi:hypothetical protein
MANYWRKRSFAEQSTEPDALAKRGLVYLMSEFFTLPGSGSVYFAMNTNGKEVEFQFYDITSALGLVRGSLIEAPASVTQFNYITPRNLNRKFADDASASLSAASAVSGGTVIATELVGNSSKAGGDVSSRKVHTLRDDTIYVMQFVNVDNQETACHMNLGWSENDPAHYRLITQIAAGE